MPIDRLSSGGIIANYRCPAACGHCLYGCSPSAQPGYMDGATAAALCGRLRRLGCRGLHIGGGEPFLDVEGLIGLVGAIHNSGIGLDYIETNAAWVTDDDVRSRRILSGVASAGGDCIMVSADPFHVEFIPFWKSKRLLRLLREMGISHFIWQERYWPLLERLDPQKTYDAQALMDVFGYDVQRRCAEEYGMRFHGRALNLLRQSGRKMPVAPLPGPCAELRSTGHFHVDYLGRYIPPGCTGMGILLDDVGKALDPSRYPVLSRLYAQGLRGLLPYAQERGYKLADDGYVSKCELCFDIRKHLISTDKKAHPDLTPESFYRQDF